MLTGITTRSSTLQEDAGLWPGGSARPVLAYLTGTLGVTGASARELLKAARTEQAEAGPGALAGYPVPGGAHLLIHYAPGSRGYGVKLTTPGNEPPPGTDPEPGTPPGNRPGPHGPSPDSSPAGDDADGTSVPGLPAPPGGAPAQPGPAEITVTIWHNVASGGQGRPAAMLDGYQPGDPVVRVFAYQTAPGRPAEEIADEAFAIFNDHPTDAAGAELASAYYGRRLRSLSVGDLVAVGEAGLAVGRAGWTLISGGLNEVRTSEHDAAEARRCGRARHRPAPIRQVRGLRKPADHPPENGDGRLGTGNTAGPSGKPFAGDFVAGGEAALTVRRAAGPTYPAA